jgi:hypothetical protein
MVSVGLWDHTSIADTCLPPSSAFQQKPLRETGFSQPTRYSCDPIVSPSTEKPSPEPSDSNKPYTKPSLYGLYGAA